MTLEERLNEEINELECTVNDLKKEIENLNDDNDLQSLKWQKQEWFTPSDLQKNLPIPRLEMRMTKVRTWHDLKWVYGLVLPHYTSTFRSGYEGNLLFIPFGVTTERTGIGRMEAHIGDGKNNIRMPRRDEIDMHFTSAFTGIPAYLLIEEANIVNKLDLNDKEDHFKSLINDALSSIQK